MKKVLAMLLALCMVFALGSVSYADGLVECDDITLTFCCSAAETTCWAQMANVFANYVNERTTGNFEVEIYAMDQLTNGSQTEGIQAVCDGSIDLSAHSNLIYSNFDQRLNVVSLPFIFDNTEEVDKVLDGPGYDALAQAEPERVCRIDASKPIEEVFGEIEAAVIPVRAAEIATSNVS